MANDEKNIVVDLNKVLLHLIDGKIDLAINLLDRLDSRLIEKKEWSDILGSLRKYIKQYEEGALFLNAVVNGNLNAAIPEDPNRDNYMISLYKQLHSSLSHLTWQTHQIANGDLNQKVTFLGDLSESFNKLIEALREKKLLEEKIITQNKELKKFNDERVRELKTFYSLAEIIERDGINLGEIYQKFINILTESWQYPDIACAKIVIYGNEFQTENYKESLWKQSAPIKVNGTVIGSLNVIYTEERPEEEEGPFLKEERLLLNAISERIGHITGRKLAEEGLREKEERLRLATNAGKIGVWDWDIVNNTLIWDDSMYNLYGINREDFGGAYDAWSKSLHPDDREYTESEIQAAIIGEREYAPEFRIIRSDGSVRTLKAESKTFFNQNGKALRMTGTNIDITEQKQAEEKLRKSEQNLAEAERIGNSGSWDYDVVNDIATWSENMFQIFDINQEKAGELIFRNFVENLVHPDDRKRVFDEFQNAIEGRQSFDTEFKIFIIDGSLRIIRMLAENQYDKSGRVIRLIGKVEDVTDQKQILTQLQASKDYLEKIINSIGSPVFVKDYYHKFCLVNDALCFFLNLTAEELIGKTGYENFPKEQFDIFIAKDKELFDTCKENINEEVITNGHGEIRTIITRKTLYIDPQGNRFLVGIINDITERKQNFEKLEVSERRYAKAQEIAHTGNWEFDIKSNVFLASDEAKNIYGFDLKDDTITFESVANCIIERDKAVQGLVDLIKENKPYNMVFDLLQLNSGVKRTIHTMGELLKDESGVPVKVIGVLQDITEQKLAEEAVKISEEKFKTLFETADDAILLFANGVWVECNTGALKVFGCTIDQIIGADPIRFSPPRQPDGRSSEELAIERITLAFDGKPQFFEWEHCRADGTTFAAEVKLNRVDLEGIPHIQAIVRDISKRKQSENKVIEQLEELTRWYEATNDREDRIIELKKEVNKVLTDTGNPPRYENT